VPVLVSPHENPILPLSPRAGRRRAHFHGARNAPRHGAPAQEAPKPRALELRAAPRRWISTGMIDRRRIRVRSPYSRTFFFNDRAPAGFAADFVRDFERWVNKKYAKQLGSAPHR